MPYFELLSKDKVLKSLLKKQGNQSLGKRKDIHLAICGSIISQQLSTKVAKVIDGRFIGLFTNERPAPEEILAVPHETLRGIGLSNAKVSYVKNVCVFFIDHKLTDRKLHKMTNQDLMELLMQIKGIGRWTVEMILMFSMGREDVFSPGDLGIQKAMTELYGIEYLNKKELEQKMMDIASRWSPYRSYACLYLWGHRDNI